VARLPQARNDNGGTLAINCQFTTVAASPRLVRFKTPGAKTRTIGL